MPQTIGGVNGPFVNVSNSGGQWVATVTWTDAGGINGYGMVMYGVDPGNLSSSLAESNPGTQHSLGMNGLSDATTYYYIVSTLDVNGNTLSQSVRSTFVTAAQQVVGNPQASPSSSTAAGINWQANCSGLGRVMMGTTPANLVTILNDGVNAFSHTVQATGLQAGTQYFYNVSNLDGQGNPLAQSAIASFTTQPANIQVNLIQPKANPWITPHGHPSTLSVEVVQTSNGKPQPGVTVSFKLLWHLGGNGQIISPGAPVGSTGIAVSDASGLAQVQFLGSSGEVATIEATSANSNSHVIIPVIIS